MTASNKSLAVDLQQVSVGYGNGVTALDDVSAQLPSGAICAVLGANGGGKSTLCKALMGIQRPQQGSIRLFGGSVNRMLKRNTIAYVPQSDDIDWDFPVSVQDVVMMGRQGQMNWLRLPSREDKRHVAHSLERVGMLAFAKRQIGELSGGQKKRVFIARALAQQARLMLLDEPFTGVDMTTESDMLDILRAERDAGTTILVVTHNLSSVPDYSDQVLMLNRRVIAFGPTAQTFTADNLANTFGGVVNELLKVTGAAQHEDRGALARPTQAEYPL
ncbi:metal ABC transporter ATP-binding protein [Carnimonas bestiolae]|uniref:metal ABC transporter ATP-binding protein n=1 Tax=Carnimonas bestiolae TaxID=3402172 RepID=UPI003EDC7254